MDGVTYDYTYLGNKLVRQSWGGNTIDFAYDDQGRPYSLNYNGNVFYYILNLQGDVVRIVNSAGVVRAEYTYNAWGELLEAEGALATINPLWYRGYVYDQETGLYYLNSRYYDPANRRFVNADGQLLLNSGVLGFNLFAYCGNNPVSHSDCNGACYYDSNGNWRHDNWEFVGDYQRKPDPQKAPNPKRTSVTIGIAGTAAFGFGGSISAGITFDSLGNIGLMFSDAYGGGTPSASVGVFFGINSADSIYGQAGKSSQTGGSLSAGPIGVGIDGNISKDSLSGTIYYGGSATFSLGTPFPEFHSFACDSIVVGFNITQVWNGIFIPSSRRIRVL